MKFSIITEKRSVNSWVFTMVDKCLLVFSVSHPIKQGLKKKNRVFNGVNDSILENVKHAVAGFASETGFE